MVFGRKVRVQPTVGTPFSFVATQIAKVATGKTPVEAEPKERVIFSWGVKTLPNRSSYSYLDWAAF